MLNLSYFIYTIHRNKICIFHHGKYTEAEKLIYDRMKRSPYRNYLEGEVYAPEEIIYFKIIAEDSRILEIEYSLRNALPKGRLRGVKRPQSGAPGISAFYIYAHSATIEQAKKRLMMMLHKDEPALEQIDIIASSEYRSERDAIHLLHTVEKYYEPVRIPWKRKG